jgi:amino-acid N-acetyltransferase
MTKESRVRLRAAESADLDWARELIAALGLPVDGLNEQFGRGYVIAEIDGIPVGLGGVEVYGRYGLLRSVGVTEKMQRGALGRAIVVDRMQWARTRGLRAVYLLTETAPGFFERLEFVRVDRESFPPEVKASKEFSEVCPDSAVAMKREF